jgi:hypothetical protein
LKQIRGAKTAKSKESVRSAAKSAEPKKGNHFKWFFGFWGIVLVIVIIAVSAFKLDSIAILIWFVVMTMSFIFMMIQLLQQWEGTVQEIKTIKETKSDGHGHYRHENVTYAFIKLTGGKMKKVRAGNWKTGDHLKKVRWEYSVRVL